LAGTSKKNKTRKGSTKSTIAVRRKVTLRGSPEKIEVMKKKLLID